MRIFIFNFFVLLPLFCFLPLLFKYLTTNT